MTAVLQMTRALEERGVARPTPGLTVRTFSGPQDIDRWLDLRHAAFAGESVPAGLWTRQDFQNQMLGKPWWSDDTMWFAETASEKKEDRQAVGMITLAMRGSASNLKPVIHWLAVLPQWRRQGVGRLLVRTLEAHCWDAGLREVLLETHSQWKAAVKFYEALGYHLSKSSQASTGR